MNAEIWTAIGTILLVALGAIGAVWKTAFSLGEIRIGVKELLTRDARMTQRVDSLDVRVNDHTTRIARLEGSAGTRE